MDNKIWISIINLTISLLIIVIIGLSLDFLTNSWFHNSIYAMFYFLIGFGLLNFWILPKFTGNGIFYEERD